MLVLIKSPLRLSYYTYISYSKQAKTRLIGQFGTNELRTMNILYTCENYLNASSEKVVQDLSR